MADLSLQLNPTSPGYKDLLILNNDLVLTLDANPSGTNNIIQDIMQRLSMYAGEWFMDVTQGVPYFQQILVKNPNQSTIDAIFGNIIMGTPGVIQLLSYSFSPNFLERVLSVTFSVMTTTGKVNYSTVIPVSPIGGG